MAVRFGKCGALTAFAITLLLGGCSQGLVRAPVFDDQTVHTSADGQSYRLQRLEKKPGGYAWVSDTQLRYYPFGFYDVERQDEHYFYVRQYVPKTVEARPVDGGAPPVAIVPPTSAAFSWNEFDVGLPRAGQWRDNFAVADMNGDGWPDLVFAPARKSFGYPKVFLGDGKGHWTLWKNLSFPKLNFDYGGAAAADFNGDHKPDIAFGMHLTGIAVVGGNGKGQFSDLSGNLPRKQGSEAPLLPSRNVLAYDWKGDGKPALVVLNERIGSDPINGMRDGVNVFVNSVGSWSAVPSEAPFRHAAFMTLDPSAKRLVLLERLPASAGLRISVRVGGQWEVHDVGGFPDDMQLSAFASARDASTVAVAYRTHASSGWWTRVELLSQQGPQWQRQTLLAQSDRTAVHGLAFGKFRAGAFDDLVFVDENGEAGLLRQNQGSSYSLDALLPTPAWRAGCEGYGLRTADLDKDGLDEVILAFAGEGSVFSGRARCPSGGAIQAFKIPSK
jgi:hypothetical protein